MSRGTKWVLIVLAVVVLAIAALILLNTPTRNEIRRSFADSQPRHVAGLIDDPRPVHPLDAPAVVR